VVAEMETTIEKTSVQIPKFDGAGDVEMWIRHVERVAKIKKWSDSDDHTNTVLNSIVYLEKEAKIWAENVKLDEIKEWSQAKTKLLTRWKPKLSQMAVISALLKEKKRSNESFYSFADRLRSMSRYSEGVNEPMLIEAFLRGINAKFSAVALQKPSTLEDAVIKVMEMSLSSSSIDGIEPSTSNPKEGHEEETKPRNEQKMIKKKKFCEFCQIHGHTTDECFKKPKDWHPPNADDKRRTRADYHADKSGDPKDKENSDSAVLAVDTKSYCDFCEKPGHWTKDCWHFKKAKSEYATIAQNNKDKGKDSRDRGPEKEKAQSSSY
jgi:hypothetical protein